MSKINNYPSHSTNPFRIDSSFVRPMRTTRYSPPFESDGKMLAEIEGTKFQKGDFQDHVRVYTDMFDIIRSMSATAVSVLTYIFTQVLDERDEVYINVTSLVKNLKLKSRTSGYNAVGELLEKRAIARKVGSDTYFINPAMFFGGSRLRWYEKYSEIDRGLDEVEKARRIYPIKSKI